MTVYEKIENVIRQYGKPLAAHEFDREPAPWKWVLEQCRSGDKVDALEYIGCSESTLARRMREMVVLGRLESRRREGKTFKEFSIKVPAAVEQPACPI